MPLEYLWLMGAMFLMLWLMKMYLGNGYYCPFCGARSEDDHASNCHGKDRW